MNAPEIIPDIRVITAHPTNVIQIEVEESLHLRSDR